LIEAGKVVRRGQRYVDLDNILKLCVGGAQAVIG
jgi:hypothetical protein